jgi:hypothetical protein
MSFTLTGEVVRSDGSSSFSETAPVSGQGPVREIVVAGSTAGFDAFEVVLRVSKDTNPSNFDPFGSIALGSSVTVEVTA